MQDPQVIDHWLDTIATEGRGLTKWEENFVADLEDQWVERRWISERQEEILERIYADRT